MVRRQPGFNARQTISDRERLILTFFLFFFFSFFLAAPFRFVRWTVQLTFVMRTVLVMLGVHVVAASLALLVRHGRHRLPPYDVASSMRNSTELLDRSVRRSRPSLYASHSAAGSVDGLDDTLERKCPAWTSSLHVEHFQCRLPLSLRPSYEQEAKKCEIFSLTKRRKSVTVFSFLIISYQWKWREILSTD